MEDGLVIVLGVFSVVIVIALYLMDLFQRIYERRHPPDDYDGMREDHEHDDH